MLLLLSAARSFMFNFVVIFLDSYICTVFFMAELINDVNNMEKSKSRFTSNSINFNEFVLFTEVRLKI